MRQGLKIYMRGQIGLAGSRKGIIGLVVAQRLKCVAPRMPAAIVDDESDAAKGANATRDFLGACG